MRRQRRVDLGLQQPGHAVFDRGVGTGLVTLDARRLDGQLPPGRVFFEIDFRLVQPLHAGVGHEQLEAVELAHVIVRHVGALRAELQVAGGAGRAGMADRYAQADFFFVLLGDEFFEVILGGLGNFDHVGSVWAFRGRDLRRSYVRLLV